MPQKKKSQEFFGIHHALAFHPDIKRFAEQRPGVIRGTKELKTIFEAATREFFFLNFRPGNESLLSFGKIYARHPDDVLDLMKLIRNILSKWRKSKSGIVRVFLLTHRTVFVEKCAPIYDDNGSCIAVIVKSLLDDTEKRISVPNLTADKLDEFMCARLVAVDSLLDKQIATLLNVKPESVKKARQAIARQDEQIAFWQNPEVVRYMQTGVITPKLKHIWRMRAKGKK
ncbi:MAG: hypothetical protein ABSE16_21400 [Verrucomicrobiota bacterium]|jgi:hypothetical protein